MIGYTPAFPIPQDHSWMEPMMQPGILTALNHSKLSWTHKALITFSTKHSLGMFGTWLPPHVRDNHKLVIVRYGRKQKLQCPILCCYDSHFEYEHKTGSRIFYELGPFWKNVPLPQFIYLSILYFFKRGNIPLQQLDGVLSWIWCQSPKAGNSAYTWRGQNQEKEWIEGTK